MYLILTKPDVKYANVYSRLGFFMHLFSITKIPNMSMRKNKKLDFRSYCQEKIKEKLSLVWT